MINEIIPVVTPNNITDIKLIKDSMDIFLNYLTKNSNISIDIKNILDQKKTPIYEEFVKIYLNAIYGVLSKSEHNEALYNALKTNYRAANIDINDIDLSVDITKLLTEDYMLTNTNYKQAKGTPTAMEYIFNIIINSGVQNDFLGDNTGKFHYKEGDELFKYTIEGTMIDAIYEHYVKPLTHPVGWAYFYQRVFYQVFTDYFNLDFTYHFDTDGLEVRCMNGDIFNNDNYLLNISHDGKQLINDNEVIFINIEYVGEKDSRTKRTTVYFASGETLVSTVRPRSLILSKDNNIIINYNDYPGNCGLYLDYTLDIKTTTSDNIIFTDISTISSTTGKKNVVSAGNVYVGSTICGDNLVNKNLDVTYDSYIGASDGSNIIGNFSLQHNSCISFDVDNLKWNDFYFDSKNSVSGKTASDECVVKQHLIYCEINLDKPVLADGRDNHLCIDVYNDTMDYNVHWDDNELKWDNFIFDNFYVGEDFVINYDINVWDTDLYFDNFIFDGKYEGGGFYIH